MRSPRCTAAALAGTTAALTVLLAAPAGAQDAATPTVGITQNQPPVVADDRLVLPQGGSASLDLLANDVDADGDALSLLGGTSAGHGTVSFAGGTATFTADSDFVGDDSFLYIASDGRGGASTGTVHITVTRVREAAPAAKPWNTRPTAPQAAPVPVEAARPAAPKAVRPVAARPVAAGPAAVGPVAVGPAVRTVVSRPQTARTVSAPARPAAAAAPMGPSTTPYVAPAARPATLPFTGGPADVLLPLGVGLLLTGGLLTATGRRRA